MSHAVDPDGPGPAARPRVTRRRAALLAGVLVALLLVVWALIQRSDDPAPAAGPTSSSPTASPEPSATPDATPTPAPAAPEPEPTSESGEPAAEAPLPALPEPLEPRALDEPAEIGPEAVARVTRLEAVDGAPQGVGEVAGPALRFTIELTNTGAAPVVVGDAVINVTFGSEEVPATEVSGPGKVPFAGEVAPGASATGTYVFVVPTEERGQVSVSLEYRAGAPVAVFQGSASAAPAG